MVLLAWHVDYWDDLGWEDPFASETWTKRQRDYVRAKRLRGLVTPQLVVGNRAARGDWRDRLAEQADRPVAAAIEADLGTDAGRVVATIRIDHVAKDLPDSAVVRPVLYRRRASTDVPAGENAGHTLLESFVVLAVGKPEPVRTVVGKGTAVGFPRPDGIAAADLGIAVLVEDAATMTTYECRSFPLAPAPTDVLVVAGEAARRRETIAALGEGAKRAGAVLQERGSPAPDGRGRIFVVGVGDAARAAIALAGEEGMSPVGLILVAPDGDGDAEAVAALPAPLPVLWVEYELAGGDRPSTPALLQRLEGAGHPVTRHVGKGESPRAILEGAALDILYWAHTR